MDAMGWEEGRKKAGGVKDITGNSCNAKCVAHSKIPSE